MRLSIAVTNYSWSDRPADLAAYRASGAQRADAAEIDTVWVADHLVQMDPNAAIDEPMLEACTTLGFLAATTERVRVGTLVTSVSIRPPALLIKAVTGCRSGRPASGRGSRRRATARRPHVASR